MNRRVTLRTHRNQIIQLLSAYPLIRLMVEMQTLLPSTLDALIWILLEVPFARIPPMPTLQILSIIAERFAGSTLNQFSHGQPRQNSFYWDIQRCITFRIRLSIKQGRSPEGGGANGYRDNAFDSYC
jgi:hypothetical protein